MLRVQQTIFQSADSYNFCLVNAKARGTILHMGWVNGVQRFTASLAIQHQQGAIDQRARAMVLALVGTGIRAKAMLLRPLLQH